MSTWIFEPGHTEAEFRARHMIVTWVRGLFKEIHGKLELDWDRCLDATFEGEIDAAGLWTGEPTRDEHLRSADFLDVENHPRITFRGRFTERTGATTFKTEVDLTIRGVTRTVPLDVHYLGEWKTPFWVGDENKDELRRIASRRAPGSTGTTSASPGRTRSRAAAWSPATRSTAPSTSKRSCSTTSNGRAPSSTTEIERRDRGTDQRCPSGTRAEAAQASRVSITS
jgi:YceI-like protein